MTPAVPNSPPENALWAVARAPGRADSLAAALSAAGLRAGRTTELQDALATAPDVVLVDPTGWEERCRRTLEAFPGRPHPPPAVLLSGADSEVLHRAGPAFAHVPPTAHPRTLARAVARAREARRPFAAYWPAMLHPPGDRDRERIERTLGERTGLAVRSDRREALAAAIQIRMAARLAPSAKAYADALEAPGGGAAEAEALAAQLSVGETYFWRYAGQFQALQQEVFPRWGERPVRIWSAGCSTGEEAYSIAIACLEARGRPRAFEVVGTDIHEPSLAAARSGRYRERTLRNLPPSLRDRYLEPDGSGWRVCEAVRARCRFERLNLGGDQLGPWVADHGPFDAIFCRNTLIYFGAVHKLRALDALTLALAADGVLFLGASETVFPRRPDLEPVRALGCFYYRRAAPPREVVAAAPPPSPPDPRGQELWHDGLGRLDAEDFAGADRAFAAILRLGPDDPRGHTGLALVRANEGRESEAAEHLERARRAGSTLPETPDVGGLLAERLGDEVGALRLYDEAVEQDPAFVMARINRAWLLRRLGRRAAFRAEMREALERLTAGRARVAPWMTGGLGWEALLELVSGALAEHREESG